MSGGARRALLLAAYAALVGTGLALHEPWRDEMLFWGIARRAGTPADMLAELRHLGHAWLWPAVLWVVARATGDARGMQAVHLVLACAAAGVLLWRAPFGRGPKALLLGGYFLSYEYAVLSRDYVFGVLGTFGACALVVRRAPAPLALGATLALMAQANAYALVLACALGLSAVAEGWARGGGRRGHALAGAVLAVAGVGAGLLQILPPEGNIFLEGRSLDLTGGALGRALAGAWKGLVPLPRLDTPHFWNTNLLDGFPGAQAGLAALLLLAPLLRLLDRPAALVLWVGGNAALLLFVVLLDFGGARHYGHFFLLLVAAGWLARGGTRRRVAGALPPAVERVAARAALPAATALLAAHAAAAACAHALDARLPFSRSREVAAYLRARGWSAAPVVAHRDFATKAVADWLERPFYHPVSRRAGREVARRSIGTRELREEVAYLRALARREVLLLLSGELDLDPPRNVRAVADFPGAIVADESYTLYESTHDPR
ncbi:MAG TPA: hypothetical protein VII13_19885 [Vicinamibacteria bacterium]